MQLLKAIIAIEAREHCGVLRYSRLHSRIVSKY